MNSRHLRLLLLGAERIAPDVALNGPLIVVVERTVRCIIASVRLDVELGLVLDARLHSFRS